MMKCPITIVSGGQTGADRAAADFALENGIPYQGWIPLGRLSEDGTIPAKYTAFKETDTSDYSERTQLNVRDSEATLTVSHGKLTGGTKLTAEIARELGKPHMHLDFSNIEPTAASQTLRDWIRSEKIMTLNIAGPRHSDDPLIYAKTKGLLTLLFD